MFTKKLLIGILVLAASANIFASHKANYKGEPMKSPYHVGAYGGYGVIDGAYNDDGQFTQGRLAFGSDVYQWNMINAGLELGFQSGNTMRLDVAADLVDEAGELQWQATLKPLVDLLVSTKTQLPTSRPVYLIVKAGAAYRQLQLNDRTSTRDYLARVAPEVQAGLGVQLTPHAMLVLFYQGVYSTATVGAQLKDNPDIDGITWDPYATICNIPTQQAGFVGIELSL